MADIEDMYLVRMMSIPQIATAVGMPRSRIRTMLLEQGIALRSRADGVRLRRDALRQHARETPRPPHSPERRERIRQGRLAWAEQNAAGVSHKADGYVEYTRGPHKGRPVHVVTMEERIGRRLLPDEVVHHIDGNRSNNDPHNLALMTRAAHARLHRREQRLAKGAA